MNEAQQPQTHGQPQATNQPQYPINSPLKTFGTELRRRRKTWRMSQQELAKRAGTTQATVAHIEAGLGNPTLDLLSRLAYAVSKAEIHITFRNTYE